MFLEAELTWALGDLPLCAAAGAPRSTLALRRCAVPLTVLEAGRRFRRPTRTGFWVRKIRSQNQSDPQQEQDRILVSRKQQPSRQPHVNKPAAADTTGSTGAVTVLPGLQVPGRALYYFIAFLWGSFSPAVRELYTLKHPPPPALFNTARLLLSSATFWPVWRTQWLVLQQRLRRARTNSTPVDDDYGNADGADMTAANGYGGEGGRLGAQLSPRELASTLTALFWSDTYRWFRGGLELGLYVFLGNVAQVIGLEYTPAARAAFLVQLQTVFIPLLSDFFARIGFLEPGSSQLNSQTLITSGMAFLGVFLLSQDKTSTVPSNWLGDSLEVLAAFTFSVYVLRLDRYARAITDTTPLAATKILVQTVCSLGWAVFSSQSNGHVHAGAELPPLSWYDALVTVGVVAWTGLLVSAFSAYVQPQCQKRVSASETGVILATQPLFAAALSVLFLGERLGWKGALGGLVILLSTVVSSFLNAPQQPRSKLQKHDADSRTNS